MLDCSSYSLLLSPKYRGLRYVLLSLSLFTFGFSEVAYHYSEADTLPFMALVLSGFLCKLVPVFILIVGLTPLLLRRRYLTFWILMLLLIFLFVWLEDIVCERGICGYFNLRPWNEKAHILHQILDALAQIALWFMVVLGVLMGRMMKFWIKENEYRQRILASQLQMETESMKEQVSSSLLCSTLRKSAESAEAMPRETSATLMQLSRLLRYQLYDCRQEKVWLESEIKFLREYLAILKYNAGGGDFSLSLSGQTVGILMPPLLFVPFLQSEEEVGEDAFVKILIQIHNDSLIFELTDNHTLRNDTNVRKRLAQLYPQKHSLVVEPGLVILKIQY